MTLKIIDLDAESDVILRGSDEDSMDLLDFDEEQVAGLSPETRTRFTYMRLGSFMQFSIYLFLKS